MKNLDKNLISFCITQRQKDIFQSVLKTGSVFESARELRTSQRWIHRTIHNIKERAALQGYSPEHDMVKTCPDPYVVKGTSTLYDKNGKIAAQWVKTTIDQEKLSKYLEGIIEASLADIKPVKLDKYNGKDNDSELLTVYPIADLHIGMLACEQETGGDYDSEIVENILKEIFTKLIERSPKTKNCLFVNLGDWIHTDNLTNETTRNGNSLDVDSRYSKIYAIAMKLLRFCIETAASKHKEIYVINCMGNHDDMGAITLGVALANIYENNKRIHILQSPAPRQYFKFGCNLIGATHGYDCSGKDLPIVMATERKEDWGNTTNHVWLTGHLHQDRVIEVGDCKVETFRTIAGKDAWTTAKGYMSGHDLKSIIYHKDHGEVERYTINADPSLYIKKN